MATYGLSSLGFSVVTSEPHPIPVSRLVFIMLTCVLGLSAIIFVFFTCKNPTQSASIIILYVVHLLIHTVHYADNIGRPVDYFEPEWLYKKHMFAEMEITFLFNIPFTIFGAIWCKRVLEYLDGVEKKKLSLLIGLIFYGLGSLLTVGHYLKETPTAFSPFVNFTISGEAAALLVFSFVVTSAIINRPPAAAYTRVAHAPVRVEEDIVLDEIDTSKTLRKRSNSQN